MEDFCEVPDLRSSTGSTPFRMNAARCVTVRRRSEPHPVRTISMSVQENRRGRRLSQDTWSHDSSPDAVGRTAASLTRDDSRGVFADNSIITPAPQNGNGWKRLRRAEADKMAASIKYGKPEVHAGADAAAQNDVRADGLIHNQSTDIIDNNAVTIDNVNNDALTYI